MDKIAEWLFTVMFWGFIGLFSLIPLAVIYKFVASEPLFMLSEGTMSAKPMKLSHKGVIWKTWDGWIPIGVDSEGALKKWKFTVKDEDKEVRECLQKNSKVTLYYRDYVLMPFKKGYRHQVYKCERRMK